MFDDENNTISETDKMGNAWLYKYDERGNKVLFHYEYDKMNHVSAIINPFNGKTNISYDKNSNVSSIVDWENAKTTYSYKKNDRHISFTNSSSATVHIEYDKNGNQTAIIDGRGNKRVRCYL